MLSSFGSHPSPGKKRCTSWTHTHTHTHWEVRCATHTMCTDMQTHKPLSVFRNGAPSRVCLGKMRTGKYCRGMSLSLLPPCIVLGVAGETAKYSDRNDCTLDLHRKSASPRSNRTGSGARARACVSVCAGRPVRERWERGKPYSARRMGVRCVPVLLPLF